MKVTVERAEILRALGHVHRVVEKRNTIPILANVLIEAANNTLKLRATDLDIEVTETLNGDIAAEGITTVPAQLLFDIMRKMPEGSQISLESDREKGTLLVKSGRSRFTLQTLVETDFPDLAAGEMNAHFRVSAKELRRLLDKTQFAISTEETRYYLNGIYFHSVEDEGEAFLRAVATDGHRLAQAQMPCPQGASTIPGIIIPRKTVTEILRLLDTPESEVQVSLSASKIRFNFAATQMISKLIDGSFPDYGRVIPYQNQKMMIVEKSSFVAAVDRVATVSSDRGRAIKLALTDQRVTLSVTNPDQGTATEEVEADYDAGDIEIGFNARYLLDIMGQVDGDTVQLALNDSGSPCLIKDPAMSQALYVLMPMRV